MKIKMTLLLICSLAVPTCFGASGQGAPSSIVAYVGACSGPTSGLQLRRDGQPDVLRIGLLLLTNDDIYLGPGNALTLIRLDGLIESVNGPKQWKASPLLDLNATDKPLFERLRRWFKAREKVTARAAGSRDIDGSTKGITLVCAEFIKQETTLTQSKNLNTPCVVVWTGGLPAESRTKMILWNGYSQLKSITLEGRELRNYEEVTGLHLFNAVASVNLDQATNITHISLIHDDPKGRIIAESDELNWTNVCHSARANELNMKGTTNEILAKGVVLEAEGRSTAALDAYYAILSKEPHNKAAHEALAVFFEEHGSPPLTRWHLLASEL